MIINIINQIKEWIQSHIHVTNQQPVKTEADE